MSYRKPDGTWTDDANEMCEAWDSIIKPVEKLTGWKTRGFDPSVSFYTDTENFKGCIYLSLDAVKKLAEIAEDIRLSVRQLQFGDMTHGREALKILLKYIEK